MKTIILCWQQKYNNVNQGYLSGYWGLGDMIRGTISTYQICKKYNYKLIVDTHLHPISLYFNKNTSIYSSILDKIHNKVVFIEKGKLNDYINNSQVDLLCFMTNEDIIHDIDDDDKQFIRNILEPNENMNNIIKSYLEKLPLNYSILHIRLNDLEQKRNIYDYPLYNSLINIVNNNKENTSILFSNSHNFKVYINKLINIPFIDTNGSHIGYDNNSDNIRDTLLDMYIISKSSKIKTYSQYSWTSGFVNWIAKCYNIEIEIINI
jgi:hypothetical protein